MKKPFNYRGIASLQLTCSPSVRNDVELRSTNFKKFRHCEERCKECGEGDEAISN